VRRRSQRLILIGAGGVLLAIAVTLSLLAMRNNIEFFMPPAEIDQKAEPGQLVRLGGLVAEGSVRRDETGALLFEVTDGVASKTVRYEGDPPDLFREGQGVVCTGRYQPGEVFQADQILARHDETYMPREAQEALERSGYWKGDAPAEEGSAP
jgi:cytochrome c-type biogenesis protein CcmE